MYKKHIEMSYEQAAKIATELLCVFHHLFKQSKVPIKLNLCSEDVDFNCDCHDIIYYVKDTSSSRYFELSFYDDPDNLGYCSILPDYNPSTYVICDIVEKRPDKRKKHEITFGFDIEKGTFLELFEILHYNSVGILREYPNLNTPIEAALKDTVILNLA